MNTYGRMLRLTSWGESHGTAIGGVLDGMPSGIAIDLEAVQQEVWRRSPGRSALTSPRTERDSVEILSGLWQGVTTGTPIAFAVRNGDSRSTDYDHLREPFRPGHADYTYHERYGVRDHRGGGRSSARETIARVIAGAIVRQWLSTLGIEIAAWASQIGDAVCPDSSASWELIRQARGNALRCPDPMTQEAMTSVIETARAEGDSVGGVVSCWATGIPIGLGEPIYDKLSARLAQAMMSINAARGFELGDGFALSAMRGSEANDPMLLSPEGKARFTSNHAGGTLGGLTTGEDLRMRIAFKPTPTIALPQQTIDLHGREITLEASGRHDPCVVPRAIAVVEAMCALVLGDFVLLHRAYTAGQSPTLGASHTTPENKL